MSKKKIVLLGATGSIGQSTLRVVKSLSEHLEIVGLAANRDLEGMIDAAKQTGAKHLVLHDKQQAQALRNCVGKDVVVGSGDEGLIDLVEREEVDMVLVAIVGTAGLHPTLAAIRTGKDIALASKEVMVMAGGIVRKLAEEYGVSILPVDSEHNAIFQCLEGVKNKHVERLILTASGGPFRRFSQEKIAVATLKEALKHPTWDMGKKITIDSASLFNKGLEMIEARWLFNIPIERIDVVVHPQSIIHSMVEFVDGSTLAQLSATDMAFPIQYALMWPERMEGGRVRLDWTKERALTFESPREDIFIALQLARRASSQGGVLPAVYNAANEVAVEAFCQGRIAFLEIGTLVDQVMRAFEKSSKEALCLNDILAADSQARHLAREISLQ